jgi:hypothetical protein
MESKNSVSLNIHLEAFRPMVKAVVEEVLAQREADQATVGSKFAYSEEEAAQLVGLKPHQLRDERGRQRISFSRIVGGRIRYTPEDLEGYLRRSREPA